MKGLTSPRDGGTIGAMRSLYCVILAAATSFAAYADDSSLITDKRGQVAGSIEPSADGFTIYDRRGKLVGEITNDGAIVDPRGRITGTIEDGDDHVPARAREGTSP